MSYQQHLTSNVYVAKAEIECLIYVTHQGLEHGRTVWELLGQRCKLVDSWNVGTYDLELK